MKPEITSIAPDSNGLTDLYSRPISYLRLSLTDRCNLRCMYCVTEDESNGCLSKLGHNDLLTYEELLRVADRLAFFDDGQIVAVLENTDITIDELTAIRDREREAV